MKKELSMEVRLLLAFGLMGLVLLVSNYFIKPVPAPVATKAGAQKSARPVTPEAVEKPEPPAPVKPGDTAGAPTGNVQEQTITVETDVYRVMLSNRGAVVKSWILKQYKDHLGKPLELVNQTALEKVPSPFSLVFKAQGPATDPNTALFKTGRSPDGLDVNFEFSDGRALTKKAFHFEKASYLAGVTTEVTQSGVQLPHALVWRGGFGDATAAAQAAAEHAIYYDQPNTKLEVKTAKDASDGPLGASGQFSFVGIEDSYFAAVFLPGNKPSIEQTTYSDPVPDANGATAPRVGVGVGGDGVNQLSLFVGPKDTDLLKKVNPKLEQVVDWGRWLGFIAKQLFVLLNWTSDHLTHNFGWAIVLVTIGINILMFPLKISSVKSAKRMQALQPQINAINERFKGTSMKDRDKQNDKNAEIMALYKRNNVNPVGGCLPLLIQMPFLYAFYTVLSVSIELRGANWLWISDLSQAENIPLLSGMRFLPVLLIVTQFMMQKMTPSPGMDPTQQKMMMLMPLMFGFMFWGASSGLVLYWLTGNVVGIAQQLLLNRWMPTPVTTPVKAPAGKKK